MHLRFSCSPKVSEMPRTRLISVLVFGLSTLLLLPNFYRNEWAAVDSAYYTDWQSRYDRLVVARLVKTRQDGFFSAGGLMGLGDETAMGYQSKTTNHQFNSYFQQRTFQSYFIYKSNPAIQGVMYGIADTILPIPGEQKLKLFRAFTAGISAMVFGLIVSVFAAEFGLLSGIFTLVFAMFCMWTVLPAGSIFWDFWAFYAPFLASAYLLADAARKNEYRSRKIYAVLFGAVLIKVLLSGFDLTTTVLVMTTVPFVFHALRDQWDLKTFLVRMIKVGIVLLGAIITGLIVLGAEIFAADDSFSEAYQYLYYRFTSHTGGDYEYFKDVAPRNIHIMEALPKYLMMPAIDMQLFTFRIHILYWHLILVFAIFTLIFILKYRIQNNGWQLPWNGLALITSTWYSILAPISWYVTFRAHSFIHTHVNTMGWQMPFTLFGFALCGFVIADLFKGWQKESMGVQPSLSSQSD